MLTGLFVFHQSMAGKTMLPTFFLCQQVGQIEVPILRAFVVPVSLTATDGTGDMAVLATGLTPGETDTAGLDPDAAVGVVAVYPLADGNLPF
jgi:hypothetical protein